MACANSLVSALGKADGKPINGLLCLAAKGIELSNLAIPGNELLNSDNSRLATACRSLSRTYSAHSSSNQKAT